MITAVRKDGSEFLAEASISAMQEQDGPIFVSMLRDVTQKRLAAERIAFLARHDSLTGLLNRGALNERLQYAIDCAERDSRTVALMFIDLDGFKGVNDSLGHAAGDRLLCAIAGRFISCARKSDTVSRIGGDEFAVVLHDPDSMEGILHFADKMLACAREPVDLKGDCVSVSASIGISIASLDRKSAEELMIEADVAMYQAKSAGKNRVALFSGADGERHARRSQDHRGAAGRFTGAAA
jgi:diguanylate cyclase (GGDEF)-like protein